MPRTRSATPPSGTIWKTGSRWYAQLRWERPDGRLIRKTYAGATRREVAGRLDEFRRELAAGLDPTTATFAEVADEYLRQLERSASPRTLEHARWALSHVLPQIGAIPVSALAAADLERMLAAGQDAGLSPQSLRHIRGRVRSVLERAYRHGRVPRNVADHVTGPRVEQFRPDLPDLAALGRLLDDMREQGDGSWPVAWALASTGARMGEILGLRWRDVDREAGEARIAGQLAADGVHHVAPKTGSAVRLVPIGSRLAAALDEAEARRRSRKVASVWVFARPDGRAWSADTLHSAWERARQRSGGAVVCRLHDLRHLLASSLLAQNVPITDVSRQLGHSNPAITARIYSHALGSHQRIAEALERSGLG